MTEPSSPRRATAEEVKTAIAAYLNADRPTHYEDMEATLNAVFALPSTHDEAIRAEEREACVSIAEKWGAYSDAGLRIKREIRARASSPRPVPAEGVETRTPTTGAATTGLRWDGREISAETAEVPAPVRATWEPLAGIWCVHVVGPDDVIATRDYLTACRVANIINADCERFAARGLTENDALPWASPAPWPYSAELHAKSVANPSTNYAEAIVAASTALLPPGTVAPEGWRDISTAPKDGTHILAWSSNTGPVEAVWIDEDEVGVWVDFHADNDFSPKYWMPGFTLRPAPSPPASETA